MSDPDPATSVALADTDDVRVTTGGREDAAISLAQPSTLAWQPGIDADPHVPRLRAGDAASPDEWC